MKLGDFMPLKITASAFSPWFPMKSEAVSKAANKSLSLFVSGFTMKRVAKDNELITPPPQKKKKRERKETQEEFIKY